MKKIFNFLRGFSLAAEHCIALSGGGSQLRMTARDLACQIRVSAECVQQLPVRPRIEQAAIIRLALHFERRGADVARELNADRRIVDEGAAASVCAHGTP